MTMKKCIKCLEVKDENKFYLRKDTGNRRGICKSCKNKLHKSKLRGDKDLREKELKTTKNWQREIRAR